MRADATYAVLLEAMTSSGHPAALTAGWEERDWHELLRLAEWHRLGGVLYQEIGSDESVPEWVAERLEESYLRQLARSALVAQTQRDALGGLAEAGITALLLKGAALVETVYDDPATRDVGDIDLLVRAADMNAAVAALAAAGFRPEDRRVRARRQKPSPPSPHHDAPLYRGDGILPVELHRHIVDADDQPVLFDVAELWRRARPSATFPQHLLPAPEDLLLHVCLHFARGREIRSEGALAQVRDMVSVIDRHEIDWEMFVANANRYRAAGRTFLALFTLAELGFAPPPGPFLALRPRGFDGFTGRQFIRERVLTSEPCVPTRTWNLSIEGVRGTLWWGRRNLASREDVPPEAARPLLSRRRALVRLVGHTLRHPRRVLHDMRISKWIERSV